MSSVTVISMSPEELGSLFDTRLKLALAVRDHSQPQGDELMKINEVADFLKVSKVTIHQWKRKGLIPFKRISNKVYFEKSEVLKALNEVKSKRKYL